MFILLSFLEPEVRANTQDLKTISSESLTEYWSKQAITENDTVDTKISKDNLTLIRDSFLNIDKI